ncbi:MAG: ankyrin repeat domain-containing protein, partial [Puniceicoccales bacterium]|nr:ankyrin repeat domain-containing protein [Puniceicoccales bacterium]
MDGIFKKKAKNVIKGGFLIYGGLGVSLAQLSASMTEGQIENYGQVQKQKSQSENIQAVIELLNQEKPDEDEIVQLIEEFMETYCYEQELRIQYATELLQRIVVYGHPDIIEFLIEAGAEINGQNQFKQTALHLATLHHQTGVVSLLLRHIDINPNIQDRFGRTPLHWAVLFQWFDITFLLLQFPSIDVNLRDISRQTPLHLAASNGDYTNAFLLCQHIFTVIDARDVNRQTPLYHAIQHGHGDVVDLLTRKGASLDCRDSWGRTPFHTAAASGHLDIIKLEHYDGQQDRSDNFGRTPLHLASIQEDLEGIQYMFQESPLHAIDINRTDQQGNTPLHSAAGARDLNIMKMLIDYGADICAKNNRQQTPWNVLHKANDPHSAEFACIADFFRTRRNSPTNVSPTKRLIALLYWWMLHFDDVDDLVVAEKITGLIRLGINIGERDYDHQRTLREVIQRILPRRLLKKFKRIVRQLWEQQLLTKKQKALF